MTQANRWSIGTLYPSPGGRGGFWTQAVPGGIVEPQQATSVDYFSVKPFSELSGVMSSPCGHSLNAPLIQRENDYTTNESVALDCSELCGYVAWSISPFEAALNTVQLPYLVV